jgi:hypothetical protein
MENENKTKIAKILVLSGFIALALTILIAYVTLSNKEIRLNNSAVAQEQVCKLDFDNMFKTIKQEANVADEAKESFKEIYFGITDKTYANDKNLVMKWVTVANPQFDMKLFDRLMTIIESKRNDNQYQQTKLADIQREWKDLTGTFPGSIFLSKRTLNITFVTSGKTKEVYRTGEDNDLELFDNKK